MVVTICATASSMLFPVISPKAAFMFTVTTPPWVVAESTATSLGMAVKTPSAASALVGPANIAVRMELSGTGAATTRASGCS